MAKWFRFEKSSWGLSASIVMFNKVCFYAGKTDHWGIGANINLYDWSLNFEIFNCYTGVEIWHKVKKDGQTVADTQNE